VYSASLAGLGGSFGDNKYGIILKCHGYNEKLGDFAQMLMNRFVNFKVDEKRYDISSFVMVSNMRCYIYSFAVLKELYVRGLRNFAKEQPYMHAIYDTNLLMSDHHWTNQQILDASQRLFHFYITYHTRSIAFLDLTAESVQKFLTSLLTSMHIEAFIHGNATEKVCACVYGFCIAYILL
jgi:secreted Zn-dependent insulinase-like peptidase